MFKFISLFSLIFVLSGCYYSFKDGCWYAPQYAGCPMKNYKSDLQRYYKADGQQINEEQKINDIKACGGMTNERGYIIKNSNAKTTFDTRAEIYNCMKNKGYKYDSIAT